MPYRLRLFNGDQLLRGTDHDAAEAAGRHMAEVPHEWESERWELVYTEGRKERPANEAEQNAFFGGLRKRMTEGKEERQKPCPRCGLKPSDQAEPYPERLTLDGPVCFGCWTPEEREKGRDTPGWPFPGK